MSLYNDPSTLNPQHTTLPDPLTLLQAFRTDVAAARSPPLPTIALSSIIKERDQDQINQLLRPTLKQALAFLTQDISNYAAALRLLSTLYSLSPSHAHSLLQPDATGDLWKLVLPRIEAVATDGLLDLLRADLLSSAASHTSSRTRLRDDTHVTRWLAAAVARAREDHTAQGAQRLALVAGLATYKLQKGTRASEQDSLGSSALASKDPDHLRIRQEAEDQLLLALARPQVLSANALSLGQEESKLTLLSSLETLSHLSSDPAFKEVITNDSTLLQRLCNLPTVTKQGLQRKPVFPSRQGPDSTGGLSSYQLDPALPGLLQQADSTLQYALSTIILNLVAYQPLLSFEERQMKKLRGMANAKRPTESGAKGEDREDQRESVLAVDQRVAKAIAAGAIQALVSMTLAGESSASAAVSVSPAIRDTIGRAFLHLTTRQDKAQRGKIAQVGGARALLFLSTYAVKQLSTNNSPEANPLQRPSSSTHSDPALSPLQALARLCITSSPAILFGSPSKALATLPALVTLYLHHTAEPLQRFEALLALTNLASLESQTAHKVAQGRISLPPRPSSAAVDRTSGAGKSAPAPSDVSSATEMTPMVAEAMESTILLEDNVMMRRAAIELLCNLAQDDFVFKRWTGEEEEEEQLRRKKSNVPRILPADSNARRRLHLLVALCCPGSELDGATESARETSLATRLAASGVLAMLSSSSTCCSHLLSLQPRTLNILVRCIVPGSKTRSSSSSSSRAREAVARIREIDEEQEQEQEVDEEAPEVDEAVESSLEARDATSSPSGPCHARASLAIRSISIMYSLISFLQWKKEQSIEIHPPSPPPHRHPSQSSRQAAMGEEAKKYEEYLATLLASGVVQALEDLVAPPSQGIRTGVISSDSDSDAGGAAAAAANSTHVKETKEMKDEARRMAVDCLRILYGGIGVVR